MDYSKYIELKEKGKIILDQTGEGMENNTLINVDSEEVVKRTVRVSLRRLIDQRAALVEQVNDLQRQMKGIDALMEDIKPLTTAFPEDEDDD